MSPRFWTAAFLASATAIVACGARTGLGVDEPPVPGVDGGADVVASEDTGVDADAPFDAQDAADAPPDVADAPFDAPFDAPPSVCDDAGVTFIYVITQENTLWSYYPPAQTFIQIGTIACPAKGGASPYSMAVDRGGTAYVVFDDGELFEVSTADASCQKTKFVPDQHGFLTFGMGFSSDTNDPGETLFVAEAHFKAFSQGLGTIDPTTFVLSLVGPFSQSIGRTELTGTGDGRLFGFSLDNPGPGSHLSRIDKATAQILSTTQLAVGMQDDAFAFSFWGGDFYLFTSPGGPSDVTKYDPTTGTLQPWGTHPGTIVGAGVSTCAPHEGP